MAELTRFGISLDTHLLKRFDDLNARKGYLNRSEAIRDLMRDCLVGLEWQTQGKEVVGTITLVYSHKVRELSDKLTELQHDHHGQIISSMHVHLDKHNCLEVIVAKGKAEEVQRIADHLISTRGVKHGKLVTTTTAKEME